MGTKALTKEKLFTKGTTIHLASQLHASQSKGRIAQIKLHYPSDFAAPEEADFKTK